jgi:hypothetical protein
MLIGCKYDYYGKIQHWINKQLPYITLGKHDVINGTMQKNDEKINLLSIFYSQK